MSELFWDFSVRTYRCDDVPEACLALQNERGVLGGIKIIVAPEN